MRFDPDREMILEGHDVEKRLADLAELEASFRDVAGAREGEAVFRVAGRWLLEERYLRERLRASLPRLPGAAARAPGVGDLRAVSLARALVSGPRIRARSNAAAICFKLNVRAFYLGARNVTLKLANADGSGSRLSHEIRIRQAIGKASGIALPRIVASDPDGARPYMWEEIVFGRRPQPGRDRARFVSRVLPRILDFYEGCGVRWVSAAEYVDLEQLASDVRVAADAVPWSAKWVGRERFRAHVKTCCETSDGQLLVGTGHGDLSSGNILLAEDETVYLVDWESSREQIVIKDLEKLFVEYAGSWTPAVERLESWRPEGSDPDRSMSCERQAMLGNLERIQFFDGIRQRYPDRAGGWRSQIARILAKEFAAASRLIRDGRL